MIQNVAAIISEAEREATAKEREAERKRCADIVQRHVSALWDVDPEWLKNTLQKVLEEIEGGGDAE